MSEGSPQVIVIAGANGAGKTSLAPFLLRDTLGVLEYVNADPIARGLSGFNPASVSFEAGRLMVKRLNDLAVQHRTFAFESTLSGRFYVRWIERLRAAGYSFQLNFLWLRSPDLAIQRVAERVRLGGHNLPDPIVRRRYASGLRHFWKFYLPLADKWAVYDNSRSFQASLIAVGDRAAPLLIHDKRSWTSFSLTKP